MPILKMLSRRSASPSALKSTFFYINRDGKSVEQRNSISGPYLHNLRSDAQDLEAILNEFKANRSYQKEQSNTVFFYHSILSLSHLDHDQVDGQVLKDIAQKYFDLRGDVLCYAVAHFDENPHLHFITSGNLYRQNKSSTLRKEELHKLKQDMEYYLLTQYPQLEHSFVEHGKGGQYLNHDEFQALQKGGLSKDRVKEIVLNCYKDASSQEDFMNRLRLQDLLHYERNDDGIPTGVINPKTGVKYRFSRLAGIGSEEILSLNDRRKLDQGQNIDF